ncbi:hypothetical protein PR202_ga02895 [Eleusine coracana subsp. coracana]|uniref:Uncharacterized protein n=1 Tax=Eleusine coracana subsp. coracana TaxID=191504 RepID=A0AAV5BKP1_ELECO|nr:hypothetical protein PR202_ga02895 [Eleusine coracana subsp. coracana]
MLAHHQQPPHYSNKYPWSSSPSTLGTGGLTGGKRPFWSTGGGVDDEKPDNVGAVMSDPSKISMAIATAINSYMGKDGQVTGSKDGESSSNNKWGVVESLPPP